MEIDWDFFTISCRKMARCTFRIPFQGWKNCVWNCKTSRLQASTWSQIKRWQCYHIFFLISAFSSKCVVTVTCDQQFQWNIVTINEQKVRPIPKASPIVIAKMREKIINLSGIFSNNCRLSYLQNVRMIFTKI